MRIPHVLILAVMASSAAAPALAAGLDSSISLIRTALDRGYGAMCSLEMQPVDRNGYYRCLDIGPYRFVEEYGRTRAFVVTPGQAPFEIMVADQSGARFSYQGPWQTDLEGQVSSWYAYEIDGGRASQEAAATETGRVGAAADTVTAYLQSLEPKPATPPAPEPAPQTQVVQPQIYYIVPPGFAPGQYTTQAPAMPSQQIPATGVPTIEGIDPPGVLVAPGVVAYPKQ